MRRVGRTRKTGRGRQRQRARLAARAAGFRRCFSDEAATFTRAPFFDGKWPLELLTTVTFAEEGAGTRVTLTWTPLNATEIERATFAANRDSMRQGWGDTFEKLNALLAGASR